MAQPACCPRWHLDKRRILELIVLAEYNGHQMGGAKEGDDCPELDFSTRRKLRRLFFVLFFTFFQRVVHRMMMMPAGTAARTGSPRNSRRQLITCTTTEGSFSSLSSLHRRKGQERRPERMCTRTRSRRPQ